MEIYALHLIRIAKCKYDAISYNSTLKTPTTQQQGKQNEVDTN